MDPSYPAKIDAFKKAFNTLNEVWGLSETPKVHIVLQHLGEYLDSVKKHCGLVQMKMLKHVISFKRAKYL